MNEFKSKRGHVFVIGMNMGSGHEHAYPDAGVISWNDPATGSWECSVDNEAGCMRLPFDLSSEVTVTEVGDRIRFGARVEFCYVGKPFVYGMKLVDEPDPSAWHEHPARGSRPATA